MSLLKWLIAGIIILCILILGGLVIMVIIGWIALSFLKWLEASPVLKGIFVLVGLIVIVGLFLAFSKWVLGKAV